MKRPPTDLLVGENTNFLYLSIFVFISINIYNVNILRHSGWDTFQNPEISETKPNKTK